MGRLTMRRSVVRISPSEVVRRPDALVVEEPMELRVDGRALAVTIWTPGADGDVPGSGGCGACNHLPAPAPPNAPIDHYGDLVVDQIIVNLL
jgi:hypothetical protein